MDYWQVLKLPLKLFALLNQNVSRLLAEKEIRQIPVLCAAAAGGDAARGHMDQLTIEMGPVAEHSPLNEQFDREGFNELRILQHLR
jgi:hypothetical protein